MPKVKDLEKCKHPNSRKTKALVKQIKKVSTREKAKLSNNIKLNLIGEKLTWFRDNLDAEILLCHPKYIQELIIKYISRFNDELEQINIKHSIGNRKNKQHASRESIIRLTVERETEEFNTCGIEIPNLVDASQLNLLRTWNGELRFLQKFKLKRFSMKLLKEQENKYSKTDEMIVDIVRKE